MLLKHGLSKVGEESEKALNVLIIRHHKNIHSIHIVQYKE